MFKGEEARQKYLALVDDSEVAAWSDAEVVDFEFESVTIESLWIDWTKVLVYAKLSDSRTAARRLVSEGALYVNFEKQPFTRTEEFFTNGRYSAIVKVGKQTPKKIVITKNVPA